MNYGDSLRQRVKLGRSYRKLVHEARKAVAPVSSKVTPLRGEEFTVFGEAYPYLVHPYNMTWRNERAVEVPAAVRFLERAGGVGAEFGNVLAHYGVPAGDRVVVDLYERAAGVVNVDILDFTPAQPLDFIVSVSTLEHVGWDERPREPAKAQRAFDHLRRMLAPGGRWFLTVPLGHNDTVDEAVLEGRWPALRQATLVREHGRWVETPEAQWRPYDPNRGANAVWMAEVPAVG